MYVALWESVARSEALPVISCRLFQSQMKSHQAVHQTNTCMSWPVPALSGTQQLQHKPVPLMMRLLQAEASSTQWRLLSCRQRRV